MIQDSVEMKLKASCFTHRIRAIRHVLAMLDCGIEEYKDHPKICRR